MSGLNCILLVDDDTITNFINKRLISRLKLSKEVLVASNGKEGLKFVKEHCNTQNNGCPELILLDINMPVMDGIEFLKYFQKLGLDREKVKVAILTTSTNIGDMEKIKSYGEVPLLNKPLTEEKLLSLLESYC